MARRFFGTLAVLALAGGALVAVVGTAAAQEEEPLLTITVHKELDGTPPGDQTFQVQVVCVHDDENVNVQTKDVSWDADTSTFDPTDGDVVFEIPTRVGGSSEDIVCTLAEVDTAAANSHTFECTAATDPAECTGDNEVTIPYAETGDADLTLTNNYVTFPPPPTPAPAPAPVVAPARFTG